MDICFNKSCCSNISSLTYPFRQMPLKHSGASRHTAQNSFLETPVVIGKSPFKSFTKGNGWQKGTFVRFTEGQSPHLELKPECHFCVPSFFMGFHISFKTQRKNCAQSRTKQDKIEHHSLSFLSFHEYYITKNHKSGESHFLF